MITRLLFFEFTILKYILGRFSEAKRTWFIHPEQNGDAIALYLRKLRD